MPTQLEVIRNYQAASRRVRGRVEQYARTAWRSIDGYRDRDLNRLVELVVPQVLAGQRSIASLNDAYLSALAGRAGIGVDERAVTGYRGVPAEVVYARPIVTVRAKLSEGQSLEQAAAAGLARLVSLVNTDMQLAKRVQEQRTMRARGFEFYRRVLSGGKNCALCVIASTQRYHVGDLSPIHPGCGCDVAMVTAQSDPGQVLNEALLEQTHEVVGARFGSNDRGARIFVDDAGREIDYKDILIRDHGEYGPTLTWRKDDFTGPGDIAA